MRHSEIPNFVHNCHNCQFLKSDIVNRRVYDWWLCKYWKGATGGDWDYFRTVLIGRYGVEPYQYWSAKLSVIDEVLSKSTPDPVFEAAGEVRREFGINNPRAFEGRSAQPATRSMTATEAAMGLTEQDITVAQAFEAALIICSDVRAWADGVGSDRAKGILSSIRVQYEIIQHAIKRGL